MIKFILGFILSIWGIFSFFIYFFLLRGLYTVLFYLISI
nr:MAG TPA: hypothetical protein [Caudoviricetes sp.]